MNLPPDEFELRKDILQKKHAEEIKEFDVGIIMKLDQKVSDYIIFYAIFFYDLLQVCWKTAQRPTLLFFYLFFLLHRLRNSKWCWKLLDCQVLE